MLFLLRHHVKEAILLSSTTAPVLNTATPHPRPQAGHIDAPHQTHLDHDMPAYQDPRSTKTTIPGTAHNPSPSIGCTCIRKAGSTVLWMRRTRDGPILQSFILNLEDRSPFVALSKYLQKRSSNIFKMPDFARLES